MPGGRPPHYKTPEELQKAVDKYFQNPINKKYVVQDGEAVEVPVLTVSGLGYSLGFASRSSMTDYDKRSDEFSYIIKRARYFIESQYEGLLQGNNVAGIIFALKNMGWKDKSELDVGGQKDNPIQIVKFND